MKLLWELFYTFAKVGVFTFGGGYAMLPMLRREIAEKKHWATDEEIMDYYAIGQCTPGVISVNTATFVGYYQAGIPGSIAGTLGLVFPSLVIITIIAAFLTNFAYIPAVRYAFWGIRACVCALIFNAVTALVKKAVIDKVTLAIFIVVLVLGVVLDISPVIFVVAAGIAGVVVKSLGVRKK